MTPTQTNTAVQKHGTSQFYGYVEDKDVIQRFLEMKYSKVATRNTYGNELRKFARFLHGNPDAELKTVTLTPEGARNVTSVHVDAYLKSLEGKASANTIRLGRAAIIKFFKHMVAVEVIEKTPADPEIIRKAPKVDTSSTVRFLSRKQANKTVTSASLTTGVTGTRDRLIVLMLVGCALRRSELVAIDVDHIRRQGEGWELFIPESKTGSRTVPIENHIIDCINSFKIEEGIQEGPLFRSKDRNPANKGRRLSSRAVNSIIKRVSGLAGETVTPHALRHTACTLALQSGATLVQAQKFLGHADPKTTIMYEHLINDAENSAAAFVNVTG